MGLLKLHPTAEPTREHPFKTAWESLTSHKINDGKIGWKDGKILGSILPHPPCPQKKGTDSRNLLKYHIFNPYKIAGAGFPKPPPASRTILFPLLHKINISINNSAMLRAHSCPQNSMISMAPAMYRYDTGGLPKLLCWDKTHQTALNSLIIF